MDKIIIVCIILLVLGILPLVIVLIKRKMLKAFMQKAVTTTAIVINCEKRYGLKGGVYYILSLEYKTIDGRQVLNVSVGSRKQKPGDIIPLMYLSDKPTKFSIDFGKRIPFAIAITSVFFLGIVWFCVWLSNLKYTPPE